ncbi:conserved protein of unknown function [Rhodovastum atsumiense]|uniref:Uncharacterized protein n=1 Tax=Rhodovastum atsumiense TaxID=504468 RepID=A0A5M6J2K2_9PROT|nr:hypothetical protein [Rhodovastum atsumiense]KAA5613845.1 hypothetical protein F1189_03460 [Rhodovastum atsumiense]CAH2601957.1 conserved protein of unknown function [Rhodovastum atsumiense]
MQKHEKIDELSRVDRPVELSDVEVDMISGGHDGGANWHPFPPPHHHHHHHHHHHFPVPRVYPGHHH